MSVEQHAARRGRLRRRRSSAAWIVVKTFLDYVHAPRLCAVRLVARHRRLARADRAGAVRRSERHGRRLRVYAACVRRELAGLAEAPEIGRHDRLHRGRLDAERLAACGLRARPRRDTTLSRLAAARPGRASAAASAGIAGTHACSLASANGSGTSSRCRSMIASTYSISSLKRLHLRAAELVDRAGLARRRRPRARSPRRRRRRTPAGICVCAAADQRQRRRHARHARRTC